MDSIIRVAAVTFVLFAVRISIAIIKEKSVNKEVARKLLVGLVTHEIKGVISTFDRKTTTEENRFRSLSNLTNAVTVYVRLGGSIADLNSTSRNITAGVSRIYFYGLDPNKFLNWILDRNKEIVKVRVDEINYFFSVDKIDSLKKVDIN